MDEITNNIHPLHLLKFKDLGPCTANTDINIPEKIENRVPTDTCFLICFVLCVILLVPYLIYILVDSDIRRIAKIDDCGNICGGTNIKYEQWQCTGQNFTDKKFVQVTTRKIEKFDIKVRQTNRECVEQCSANYSKNVGWYCISKEDEENPDVMLDTFNYVIFRGAEYYFLRESVICRIIFSFFISVGVSVVVVYLLRCSVTVMVWAIPVCLFIVCSTGVGFLYGFLDEVYGGYAVIPVGILIGIFLGYIAAAYFLRNKIKLVILLLEETIAAICTVPSLVIVPIFTFITSSTIVILFATSTIYMSTVGELIEDSPGKLEYSITTAQSIIMTLNFIITIWALYIVNGIQYTITAGVVSEWYFAKDKTNLTQPLKNMAIIVCKYHLGTIAFGSIILLIAHVARFFLKSILKRVCPYPCISCWIKCARSVLEFVTKRTYIMTAMHGQPFCKSGRRAANLIIGHMCSITIVVTIGTFIFVETILIIAIFSVLLSSFMFLGDFSDNIGALIIIFCLAVFVGITFMSLFKTTTDTIFMCICEDSILNDGMSRPYAMSTNLIQFIENSKKPIVKQSFIRSDPETLDTKI